MEYRPMNTKYFLSIAAFCMLAAVALPAAGDTAPATTTCKDGTTSTASGKGACSHHGGVQATAATPAAPAAPAATARAATPSVPSAAKTAPAATTPAAAAPAAGASAAPPAGATAKCNDGTYSTSKNHSGACSKHGGVAGWLSAS